MARSGEETAHVPPVGGAAALAGVLSLGDGVEACARQQLEREGVNVVSVTPRTSDTRRQHRRRARGGHYE